MIAKLAAVHGDSRRAVQDWYVFRHRGSPKEPGSGSTCCSGAAPLTGDLRNRNNWRYRMTYAKKTKSILLVEPPFYSFFQYDFWNYAFSCSYLAAILNEAGHKAYIYDADKYFEKDPLTSQRLVMVERQSKAAHELLNKDNKIWKHFIKTLRDISPDCVIIATWTFKNASTRIAIELIKDNVPSCKIAVGGYHVTALPNSFDNMSEVDGILIGPAEQILLQWLNDGCKKGTYIHEVSKTSLCMTINPDRNAFLYPESYTARDFNMTILSRGCHGNCAFCCNKLISGQRHQFAHIDYIRKELDTVTGTYKNKAIVLADAHFFESKKNNFLYEILKSYNIHWSCALRVDSLSPEFCDLLAESGCRTVFCGLERGRDDLLRRINKKITVAQIRKASELLTSRGINLTCSFIAGFPDDDEQSILDTKDFALSLGAKHVSLNSFTPLPGTSLWEELRKEYTEQELLNNYNQLNPVANFIKSMSSAEYSALFKSVLADFEKYNDLTAGRLLKRNPAMGRAIE